LLVFASKIKRGFTLIELLVVIAVIAEFAESLVHQFSHHRQVNPHAKAAKSANRNFVARSSFTFRWLYGSVSLRVLGVLCVRQWNFPAKLITNPT